MRALGHRIKAKAKNVRHHKSPVPGVDTALDDNQDSGSLSSAVTREEASMRTSEAGPSTEGDATSSTAREDTEVAPALKIDDETQNAQIPTLQLPEDEEVVDLWKEAFDKLSEEQQHTIRGPGESTEAPERVTASIIPDLITQTRARQEECEQKFWRIKLGRGPGDEIVLRDQAALIISWLTRAGDVGVMFGPSVVKFVWPCVKSILKVPVREAEQMAALLTVADKVARVTTRGRVYEKCFLDYPNLPADVVENVREALVALYKACLDLLATSISLLNKNLLQRMVHSIFQPDALKKEAGSDFSDLEEQLSLSVEAASAITDKHLLDQMRKLDAPIMRVDGRVSQILESLAKDELLRILDWISPVQYSGHHNSVVEKRKAGTCEWLLRHPKFKAWESSSGCALLWLKGLSGAGKTFLASKVIDYRRNLLESGHNDEALAFFYFSRTDKSRNSDLACLRSLVRQLSTSASRQSQMQPSLKALYQECRLKAQGLDRDACRKQLEESIKLFPRITIILDALDECNDDERADLTQLVADLMKCSGRPLQVFISSRPDAGTEAAFRDRVNIEMGVEDNQDDIANYIKDKIHSRKNIGWKYISEKLKDEVVSTLAKKGRGMFRWSALHIDELLKLTLEDDVRKQLGQLPSDLKHTYDDIYGRQAPEGTVARHVANRAMMWVMAATELLTSRDLLQAVLIDPSEYIITRIQSPNRSWNLSHEDAVETEEDKDSSYVAGEVKEDQLLKFCANLLILQDTKDRYDGTTKKIWVFAHASVAEYFEEHYFSLLQAHAYLGSTSLVIILDAYRSYIAGRWLGAAKCLVDTGYNPKPSQYDFRRLHEHRFFRYAIKNWGMHLAIFDKSLDPENKYPDTGQKPRLSQDRGATFITPDGLGGLLERFLGRPSQSRDAYKFWLRIYILVNRFYLESSLEGTEKHSIFGMVQFGIFYLVRRDWWQAAITAAETGKQGNDTDEDSSMLVDTSARVRCGNGWSLLQFACELGNAAIVKSLVAVTADVNEQDDKGDTALSLACRNNHLKSCQVLIEAGCSPNLPCGLGNPLYVAVKYGHTRVVRYLLSVEANPNQAIELPDHHLDYDDDDDDEQEPGSPLALAAYFNYVDVVRCLMEEGKADPNMLLPDRCKSGTAAICAACERSLDTLEYLIRDAHVDPNALVDHPSPLKTVALAAIANARYSCCDLFDLMELGVDFTTVRNCGGLTYLADNHYNDTALEDAVERNDLDTVKYLLEELGLDVNHQTSAPITHFGCALAAALALDSDHLLVLEYLLEKGADVNLQTPNGDYHSPLAAASQYFREDPGPMEYLIKHGAEVNLQLVHGDYGSVLAMMARAGFHTYASGRDRDQVQLLLDHGADINLALDHGKFRCALMAAVWAGREEMVVFLLDRGADVNFHVEHSHVSVLDMAVVEGGTTVHTEKHSLDLGLEIRSDLALEKAESPLMVAAWAGHEDLVQLLIARGADVGRQENQGWEMVLAKKAEYSSTYDSTDESDW